MTDLTPSLRDAATVAERIAARTDDPVELAALRLLAGLVPGKGVEVRYGAENVRAYVDGIVAGLTGRQHYIEPLAALHRPADEHDDPITWCDCRPSDTPGSHPGPCRLLANGEAPPRVVVVDADRDDYREYLATIAPPNTARAWAEADLVVDRHGRVLKWRGRVTPAPASSQTDTANEGVTR